MIENSIFLNIQRRCSFCVQESTYKKAFFPFRQYSSHSAILDVSRCHLKLILLISFFFSSVSDQHVIIEVNRSAVINGISQLICQFVGACVTWQTQLKKACLCSRKTVGFLQQENNTPLQVIPCIIILQKTVLRVYAR